MVGTLRRVRCVAVALFSSRFVFLVDLEAMKKVSVKDSKKYWQRQMQFRSRLWNLIPLILLPSLTGKKKGRTNMTSGNHDRQALERWTKNKYIINSFRFYELLQWYDTDAINHITECIFLQFLKSSVCKQIWNSLRFWCVSGEFKNSLSSFLDQGFAWHRFLRKAFIWFLNQNIVCV